MTLLSEPPTEVKPLCPVFGACGGCDHQDIPYDEELKLKEEAIRCMGVGELGLPDETIEPITASPKPYFYRSRLDLSLLKTKTGEFFVGFRPAGRNNILEVEACPISERAISDFVPELKRQAAAKLPANYRIASLVVKTGADGRVCWGGIGRHSLRLLPKDYLWTEVDGQRVYYSLDTFFQANTSILPQLISRIREWLAGAGSPCLFFDLYAGVGLFGILLAGQVKRAVLMENNPASVQVARYNKAFHRLENVEIIEGRVESNLKRYSVGAGTPVAAMIDPPRKGLSEDAMEGIQAHESIRRLFYLSCGPEALCRDLKIFLQTGWRIKKMAPFDFFPKTKHIETLVLLER